MISVTIQVDDKEVGYLEIVNERVNPDDTADYSIKLAVERGNSVGVHWRNIHKFPRKEYNALALVKQALETLTEKELSLDRYFDHTEAPIPPALAGGLRGALRSFQAGER